MNMFIIQVCQNIFERCEFREVREETVRKFFLQGDCEVLVVFEDTGREILIDDFSSEDDIRKYLGPKFINKKRK